MVGSECSIQYGGYDLLLKKLSFYGFIHSAVQWVKSYLTDNCKLRSFIVKSNGSYSERKSVLCGVPQGSCRGPLLFLIFTNDLPFVFQHATVVLC